MRYKEEQVQQDTTTADSGSAAVDAPAKNDPSVAPEKVSWFPEKPSEGLASWVSFLRNVLGIVRDGGIIVSGLFVALLLWYGRDPATISARGWAHIAVVGFGTGAIPGLLYLAHGMIVPGLAHLEEVSREMRKNSLAVDISGIRSWFLFWGMWAGRRFASLALLLMMLLYGVVLAYGLYTLVMKYSQPLST